MSLDAMWLFLYAVLREPLIGAAAITVCFGVCWALLSAFNRVGKS
jgi:hypothetical protein